MAQNQQNQNQNKSSDSFKNQKNPGNVDSFQKKGSGSDRNQKDMNSSRDQNRKTSDGSSRNLSGVEDEGTDVESPGRERRTDRSDENRTSSRNS